MYFLSPTRELTAASVGPSGRIELASHSAPIVRYNFAPGPGLLSVPILPKQAIKPFHDPLHPLHARINQLVCSWAFLRSSEQIVSGLHVQTGKNRRHDSYALLSTSRGAVPGPSNYRVDLWEA